MKTIRFQLLLLALFVMVGCQKDEMSTSMKKGSYSLVASIENNDSTSRTAVDENGRVTWVATDAIGVFGTQTNNAKFESISSGSNVLFVGNMDSSNDKPTLAYYPYDKDASLDGNALSFTLPSEYSYTGQSYAPMLGIKQANGNFVFKHLVGLLKVTIEEIPQNATKFVITSKGNEPLPISGIAKVEDVTVDNAVLELQALPDSYSVTYNFSPTVFSSDKIFYIPLPVGTYERLVVSLIGNEDDVIFERSISNLKVERKAMIEMPVVGCEEGISYTLADDVFPIYKSDENYITSVESNKITYKSNIPADRRPQVGQILLFSDVTEMFPTGFLGKIVNIAENDNGFVVETEPAALDEAFWNLKINKTIDVFSGFDGKELYIGEDVSSRSIDVSDEFEYPLSIPIDASLKFQKDNINYYGSLVGSIHTGIVLSYNIFIDEGVLKDFEIKTKLNNSTLSLDDIVFGFGKEGKIESKEGEKFIDIKRPLSVAILGPVVIIPTLNWGVMCNASGSAEFGFSLGYEGSLEASIYVDPTSPIPVLLPAVNIADLKKMEQTDEGCYAKLQGNAAVGPFVGFEFNFYGIVPVGFRAALMSGASGEFVVVPDIYKIAKNTQIGFGIQTRVEGSIGLGLFKGWKVELNAGMTFDFPFYAHLYALPIFENLKYGLSENGDLKLTLQTKNQTLFYYKYGMKIYKKNGEEVYSKYFSDKYTSNVLNDHDEMIYIVNDLEPGETYIARPFITNKREGDMFTDLSLEFTTSENINVTTGDVTDVSYNSASFDGTILGVNFNSDFEYGIFCSLENEPTVENSVKVEVGKIEDGKFTASTNQLKEGERYSYRAYVCKNGEYHYGEIKDFVTIDMSVKSLDYSNLTNNSVTLAGIIEGLNNLDQYEYGICYSTGVSPSKDYGTLVKGVNIQNGSFSVNVSGLTENTTYYWCAYAIKDGKYYYGSIKSFKTLNPVEDNEGMTEREILVAFYNATDGDNWSNNENWCSDKPLGEWHGITTDGDGYVTSIYLSGELVIETKESRKFGLKGNANLSNLSKLEDLYLEHNELTSLTVENCPNLYRLLCSYNALTKVNVDGVGYLSLDNNQLTSLDFSDSNKFAKLIYLQADNNQLSTINLSACSNLSELSVSENKLTSLDVSSSKALNRLSCDRNLLTNLNVTGCNELVFLQCFNNQLTTINLKGLVNLTRVDCRINKLKSLDLSGLNKITYLELRENELTELDVSDLIKLKGINCNNNKLTKLKMHEGIISLDCSYNSFTELDLSDYANLEQFVSMGNSIQKLNFEGCSKLASMQLDNSIPVESMNLTGCTSFASRGLLLFDTLFKEIYLPASLSNYQSNFKVWGDWIESENRYQYPKFHWQ